MHCDPLGQFTLSFSVIWPLKFLVSGTENPHLSFQGTDVSTFLRLFYDTFHRDRAVRQLLLTAFQYLRMRPVSGWDRVKELWEVGEVLDPSPICLGCFKWVGYGCRSNVRWGDQILGRVNGSLGKCRGTYLKHMRWRVLKFHSDKKEQWFEFTGFSYKLISLNYTFSDPIFYIFSEDLYLIKNTSNARLVKQVQWSREGAPCGSV